MGYIRIYRGITPIIWRIKRKITWKMTWNLGVYRGYLWLAGNGGLENEKETTVMGYTGTAIRIHFFVPSEPKAHSTPRRALGV